MEEQLSNALRNGWVLQRASESEYWLLPLSQPRICHSSVYSIGVVEELRDEGALVTEDEGATYRLKPGLS